MPERVLVTGGCGFIGGNFARYLAKNTDYEIIVLDKLTYAGRLENIHEHVKEGRIKFIKGDICDRKVVEKAMENVDFVVHFAAESHVDNSIRNPDVFVTTNVLGTNVLLDVARKKGIEKFIHISTDEVYGSIEKGYFTEESPFRPSSPYSASKAAADLLCQAFFKTYDFPVCIVRPSNNYGYYQFPEKLIPKMILLALHDKDLPIYGTGKNVRDWTFVMDTVKGILLVMEKGKVGEAYNLASNEERENIYVAKKILELLDKPEDLITFVEDRPGHDFRYALDSRKLRNLGWRPEFKFEEGLEETVNWYLENEWWWKPIFKID